MLVAISIPIFTSQLEKSREAVDASNLRAAYAEGQVEALTDTTLGSTDVTKWYSPKTGKLQDTLEACGKGTETDGGLSADIPEVCTYNSGTDVRQMGIKVTFNENGVSAVTFAAN